MDPERGLQTELLANQRRSQFAAREIDRLQDQHDSRCLVRGKGLAGLDAVQYGRERHVVVLVQAD